MNNLFTSIKMNDGFGAQYQKIIETFIYCKIHNLNFIYRPLHYVEHNYDNDPEYINKLEKLMNLKTNILNIDKNNNNYVKELDFGTIIMPFFENNIDFCCESNHMKFIKNCYCENKNKDFFNNNKFNVAVHIRRDNSYDKGNAGERITTPNSYYLNIINIIREKYKEKEIFFHIYSQGDINNFLDIANKDVYFYLNYDLIESFKGMVAADCLVTSPSSLSYTAALLSDGEIYYKKFWHNPKKEWIIIS